VDGEAISTLAPTPLEQAKLPQILQQAVEEPGAGSVRLEPLPKVAQDAEVEAGGVEGEVEGFQG
jgi:hypothetical protein